MAILARSQRDLIQEDFYPDEFRVLVCCLLLNRTKGEQVRGVVDRLFAAYPDADALANANLENLTAMLRPLGFHNRRAATLVKFAQGYRNGWEDVSELHGVGEYAEACHRIFFKEDLGDDPPSDGPLTDYWIEAKAGLWPEDGWPRVKPCALRPHDAAVPPTLRTDDDRHECATEEEDYQDAI